MTAISTNDIKPGMALDLPDGLFQIVDYQHVKPGKGKAFVRTKLRNLETGAKLDRTFRADETVERAIIDRRDYQFLYRDDMGFNFMDGETFSQIAVASEQVGDVANYLVDGATVVLAMYQGRPVGLDMPASVELEVTEAEPGVKGDRVSGATKPVTLQTGLVVQVPLFVEQGDRIKVDTRSGTYMTRVT
ncbi:MAG: elongation factor P [Acidimicrobiia bacterium]|nr:elongation factor P [Acidimicrobiia bacterium]